jgi:FAD/FMN-containing dehydrogenase
MITFINTNLEISEFFRNSSKKPLHITGNEKSEGDLELLSLSKMSSVLLYEPEEMIISAQAGIALEKLDGILADKGQWIPTLVTNESLEKTLGAAVAMDRYHPRSKTSGMLRTTILGGTFCTTKGEIFKSGSRVVKSVAGYDIHRAFCGSKGAFGVILDLTLKVQPRPEIFFRFFSPNINKEKIQRLYPVCLEEHDGKLLVECAGYTEDIENDLTEIKKMNGIEEISETKWDEIIREVSSQKRGNTNSELLDKVKEVFDPQRILV